MKFQQIVTVLFFASQFAHSSLERLYEDGGQNSLPLNGVAVLTAQQQYEKTQTELQEIRVSKQDVIKGYERLMSQARRIPRAAQTTYIVAIENHPKVVEARADIAQNGTFYNRSGILVPNRHNETIAGLQLAQIAIANNSVEIERRIESSQRYLTILQELNAAHDLVKSMLP